MTFTFALVERDHGAIAPKDQLHVQDRSGEQRLEHVGPFAHRGRFQPSGGVLGREVRQNVACLLFVEAELQARQLATSLQGEEDLARESKVPGARQNSSEPARHQVTLSLFG